MAEPEPDWDTVMEMEAESRRDHFFPVADEDVTFIEGEPPYSLRGDPDA